MDRVTVQPHADGVGTVRAWLDRPSRSLRRGILRTSTQGDNGVNSSGVASLRHRGEEELRDEDLLPPHP